MKRSVLLVLLSSLSILVLSASAPSPAEASGGITACFDVACTCGGYCALDASCTTGEVETYAWTFDDGANGFSGGETTSKQLPAGHHKIFLVASRGNIRHGDYFGDNETQYVDIGCN